ncbi:hypothetical protein ACIRVF_22370 [Kitasatospora sp. NPDC101157]
MDPTDHRASRATAVVQRGESLAQDGFVGPETWPALRFVAW